MITELATGVWRIDGRWANVYLYDRQEVVLVDAGTPLDAERIIAGIREAGYTPADVDRGLVTHFDVAHAGGLWRLDDALDAPVHMAAPTAAYLTREASPSTSARGLLQRTLRVVVRPPDLSIEHVADRAEVGGLTAHHTPGHTPGHTVYVDETVAFLGDLVRSTDGELSVLPRLLHDDPGEVAGAIRVLIDRVSEFAVAAPGHGPPLTEGGYEALRTLAA